MNRSAQGNPPAEGRPSAALSPCAVAKATEHQALGVGPQRRCGSPREMRGR